jgi:hypothetical protein
MSIITNPAYNAHYQAAMTNRSILNQATYLTGKRYKRGQYQAALDDIQAFIDKINKEANQDA